LIRLSTFGSVDLRAPDNTALEIVLAQPKRVALVVYLAAARPPGFHRRDRLVALFWPELDDARARDALSQALRFLRQALGSDVVITRGVDEVGIDRSRMWCDVEAFRTALDDGRALDALQLYRGDFLDGVFVEEASGFEEWVESERAALRELAARGARQLAERNDEQGSHTAAVGWGRRAAELAPDDERAFRRLLGLLDRAGDRAGALQAYDDFTRRLRAEYGAEPAPETRRMVEAIRHATWRSQVGVATPPESAALSPVVKHMRRNAPEAHSESYPEPLGVGASLSNGRYVIERILGEGGMATVYLAQDVRHERKVAVKVLRSEVAETIGAKSLLREIRIAASLQHPHIVPLFDSGESDGQVFYVMPYIAGESLRARLEREPTLPIDVAVRIARDMADALAYAHGRGIVHRDIKPDNVLLSGDQATGELHALVADFGVAKALDASREQTRGFTDGTLTALGVIVGTPRYMAPEQATGGTIDHRADVYAWGVVAYEMLASVHPFSHHATPQALVAAHIGERPVSIFSRNQQTPLLVGGIIMRSLEKDSAARPVNGGELLAEIERAIHARRPNIHWLPRRARTVLLLAVVIAVAGLSSSLWTLRAPYSALATATGGGSMPDTTRYVVLPFAYDSNVVTNLHEIQQLSDAFSRWVGIRTVDDIQLRDALARRRHAPMDLRASQLIAADLKAGRYVIGSVVMLAEGLRIEASVYDTRTNRVLRSATTRVGSDATSRAVFDALGDSLVFREERIGHVPRSSGTRTAAALQAFARGHRVLEEWDLAAADSAFSSAIRYDESYAEGYLWLAQVRVWSDKPPPEWRIAARQASRYRSRLSSRDQVRSDALLSLSAGDVSRACADWREVINRDTTDFASWYGLGHCLRTDSVVVHDALSRSGWRFRSSYEQAVRAYRKAFELLPSIHNALSRGAFEQTRQILLTSASTSLRRGRPAAPDTGLLLALPGLEHDTLEFVPYPIAKVRAGEPGTVPVTLNAAVSRQRALFREIAAEWMAAFPRSVRAIEAVAVSLELVGDAEALGHVRHARSLASDPADRLRLAVMDVWLRTKMSLPSDTNTLLSARVLADSLLGLETPRTTTAPRLLASLAALHGRAGLAAAYSRLPSVVALEGRPEPFAADALALGVFAALGGPLDSLRALERRINSSIEHTVVDTARKAARVKWLMRSAALAFPVYRFPTLGQLNDLGWAPVEAQQALARSDTTTVRRILAVASDRRRLFAPADLTLDALYPEAWLLSEIGDKAAAKARIDPTLNAVAEAAPQTYADPVRAASLVRSMALRAEVADALGDRDAASRWARAVSILWHDADAFLQPVVKEMNRLTR
jgi:serine/threonine protein kinase/DNA-binding SARP family transcriptional activator